MPFFDSDGLKIHYEDRGIGDPAVLVHGFASSAKNNWVVTGWLDLLARHRVVALDCRVTARATNPMSVQLTRQPRWKTMSLPSWITQV